MRFILLFLFYLVPSISLGLSLPPFCPAEFVKDTIEFSFTGYKFTAKTPVKGTFKKYSFTSSGKKGIDGLIKSLKFDIDAASIDTNLAERNKTLFDNVFKELVGGAKISGKVKSLDSKSGVIQLSITMNGVTQTVPMAMKFEEKTEGSGIITGVGKIDMLEFKMNKSYENISNACKALHTGPDGVAKTWSEVGLNVKAEITFKCKK